MPAPQQPSTPEQWAEHAIHVHREGLAVLDRLHSTELPAEVAAVQTACAGAFFEAASSAAAIGELTARLGGR